MKTKTSTVDANKDVSVLEKYIQVMPSELLEALKASAIEKGISLDVEIAVRLTAYMAEPDLVSDNSLLQKILRQKFTDQEAKTECLRRRLASGYVYEIEKLRLFLQLEAKLPRNMKERFMFIDVKVETKRIKAELEAEEKRNRTKEEGE